MMLILFCRVLIAVPLMVIGTLMTMMGGLFLSSSNFFVMLAGLVLDPTGDLMEKHLQEHEHTHS